MGWHPLLLDAITLWGWVVSAQQPSQQQQKPSQQPSQQPQKPSVPEKLSVQEMQSVLKQQSAQAKQQSVQRKLAVQGGLASWKLGAGTLSWEGVLQAVVAEDTLLFHELPSLGSAGQLRESLLTAVAGKYGVPKEWSGAVTG